MKRQQRIRQPTAPPTPVLSKGTPTDMHRVQQERCDCCRAPLDRGDIKMSSQHGTADEQPRAPLVSRSCSHVVCMNCACDVNLQEEAKREQGSPHSLPWMDCPVCHVQYAFHADMLGSEARVQAHHSRKVSAQSSFDSGHYQPAPAYPPPPTYYHHHYGPQTPHYGGSHHPYPAAYVSPPHSGHPYPRVGYSWHSMDYSPASSRGSNQSTARADFHPPPPPIGLSPPDIQRMDTQSPPKYPQILASDSTDSLGQPSLPRKRLRTPISRKAQANKAMAHPTESFERQCTPVPDPSSVPAPATTSQSSPEDWLTCRICHKPVLVTCQRLLSGPPPDHEALWPQVRLGKRLAAALRQHNQQYHPDWFMWNVKGRVAMTNASAEHLEEDDAIAQTALIKALEASFEHLPHVAGQDTYETKSDFLSHLVRRVGFAYAYISYTSSEWTKWQQWNKDGYSRVQIQAKARQLLDTYESHLKQAIDDQWVQISSWAPQEKLDLYQNIFVLPQCIFECLHHGRLPMHYGDVTTDSDMN